MGEDPEGASGAGSEEGPFDRSIWKGGIGSGFRKGTLHAGISFGGGPGTPLDHAQLRHDAVEGALDFGWVFSDVKAGATAFRGNFELLGELFGGFQTHPRTRHFVGLTPILRYDFATGSRWVPFVNAGAGLTETDIGGTDLAGEFQFNLQAGAGTHFFVSEDLALTVQCRFLHVSNAHIEEPDRGSNTLMVLLGLTWFF